MSKIFVLVRILLGLVFLIFGSNGLMMFLTGSGFIPMPPPSESMQAVMSGFMATGYLMILVKSIQVFSALLLLTGFFVNLALTLLGPIIVNILMIHIFVEPDGLPMAILICILWGLLLFSRWRDFKVLIKA